MVNESSTSFRNFTYWLGMGVLTAGLGAGVMAGQGVASASTGDASTGLSATGDSPKSDTAATPATGAKADDQRGDDADTNDVGATGTASSAQDTDTDADAPEAEADDPADEIGADEHAEATPSEESATETARAVTVADSTTHDLPVVSTADAEEPGPIAEDTSNEPIGGDPVEAVEAVEVATPESGTKPAVARGAQKSRAADEITVRDSEPEAEIAPAVPAQASVAVTAATATVPVAGADTLVNGRVTWGTIWADIVTWLGWRRTGQAVTLDPTAVPDFVETFWLGVRRSFYGDPPVPTPTDPVPTEPEPAPSGLPAAGALIWETNFTSVEELQQYWSTQTGRWGASSGENQYYTADLQNVSINAQGYLVLTARQEKAPDGVTGTNGYTSARLVTYGKVSVEPDVRIVARMQLPYTKGLLPAFWMVGLEPGHEFDWPRQGEVDVVEYAGTGAVGGANQWTGNIHGPAATDNTVDVKLQGTDTDLGFDLSAGFHDYGIDWYTDHIVWHVDGAVTGEISQAQYEAQGGDWTAFSGAWSHYLILNVAVGNDWTGDPDATSKLPATMLVDWIRVYSLA